MNPELCLDEERLHAYLAEECSEGEINHLRECAQCQKELRKLQSETHILQFSHASLSGGSESGEWPTMIGKYVVVGVWDEHDLWTTYRGLHAIVHREVLIQVSRQLLIEQPAERDAWLASCRRWMERREGVATVLDAGFHDDAPYLVVEYNDGMRLDRLSNEERPTGIELIFKLSPLLHSLAAAPNIPHKSLRLTSIVLEETGPATLVDWAASQELTLATPMGTVDGTSVATRLAQIIRHTLGLPLDIAPRGELVTTMLVQKQVPLPVANLLTEALDPAQADGVSLPQIVAALPKESTSFWKKWLNM